MNDTVAHAPRHHQYFVSLIGVSITPQRVTQYFGFSSLYIPSPLHPSPIRILFMQKLHHFRNSVMEMFCVLAEGPSIKLTSVRENETKCVFIILGAFLGERKEGGAVRKREKHLQGGYYEGLVAPTSS